MNNEEKFKKSLQDKIASKDFPFDEREWEKAAAILDNSRKGGNRTPLFLASGIILILATLFSVGILSDFKAVEDKQKPATLSLAKDSEKLIAAKSTSKFNVSEIQSAKSSNTPTKQIEKVPSKKVAALSDNASKTNSSSQQVSASANTNPATTADSGTDQSSPVSSAIPPSQTSESSSPSLFRTNDSKEPVTLPVSAISSVNSAPSNHVPVEESIPLSEAVAKENNDTNNSLNEIPKEEAVTVLAAEKSPLSVPADTLPKSASIPTTSRHNILNFELGAAYMFGWKNSDGRDASGLNVVVGINYLSVINKQIWFSLGVQYTSVRNLSYSSKTSKVTRYKLGEESDVTTITPSTLHYAGFPFKLHMQYNSKNSFGLGYTANYLINVESKVETYTQKLHSTENYQTYTTGGYTEGFKLFSSQVGVYYRRELIKDLSVNAEFVFGLNDIKENSFFNSTSTERNTGIKLTLTYNLFKH